jgi:3-hydroxyisobutyrate dehydrogenase-like beta-hydroxyacid dehydrogenase
MNIGVIGIGQMGQKMAARLAEKGHTLTLWNRSAQALRAFEGRARIAFSPQEVMHTEVVITMLADDAAVESVWLRPRLKANGVHLNMASVSLRIARELAQLQDAYVSAPVFGRPSAAAKGELDIIAAGPAPALERCEAVFKALARQVFVLGEKPEHANAVKIARNFLLATVIESLGEAFALVRKSGVDPARFLEILASTSLAAPAYKNYGRMMVERSFEPAQFSMALGVKDVELALATAREKGVPLPSAEMILRHLRQAVAHGYRDKDWTALAEYLEARESG